MNDKDNTMAVQGASVAPGATTKPQPPIPPQPPKDTAPPPAAIPTKAPSSQNPHPVAPPGWRFQRPNPGTFADVSKVVNNRPLDPTKIYNGGKMPAPTTKKMAPRFAGNTVQGPASIVELARALKNDPQLIFEFVYNNIEWEPGWGVQKGGLGCLLDGMGNSFDQSMLLVALLRQAGFTANYVLGQIQLTEAQFDAWFNTNSAWCAYWYAQYANIPGDTPVWDGTEYTMVMSHVWVEVVVGLNTYVLDPSYKTYTRKSPVGGLDTILGYNQSTFLSDAASGATITADYAQNMNHANIGSDLTTMTSNLISYINGNTIGSASPGTASVDDILGGQDIVPITLPFTWQTSLSYEAPGDTPTVWTGDVPLGYKTTLEVQYPLSMGGWAIDETFTSDQLAGGRLTLTFDGSLHPVLTLNGTVVATGSEAQGVGTWNSILLTVNHNAYASPVYPQQWWQSFIYAGQYYLIGNAWGNLGRGQANFHQTQLAAALAAPTPVDEEINGEWMSTIWWNWAAQSSKVADLACRLNLTHMNFFHQVGMVSYTVNGSVISAGTDIGGVSGFSSTLNYDFTQLSIVNTVSAMHGVALEAASLAQFNGVTPGISTTTVIDRANRTANVTFGGTVTAGDVLTVTVHDAALSGGSKAKNYTVLLGDTLTTIAAAMTSLINADTDFQDIGVTAASSSPLMMVSSASANQTSYTSSTSGGATETITIAFEKIYQITPSNWMTGTNVASILSANGYTTGDISAIDGWITSGITSVMIGDTPGLTIKDWTGDGDWVMFDYGDNGGALGLINSFSKGGSSNNGPGKVTKDQTPPETKNVTGEEPVSLYTGNYLYSRIDMVLGSQSTPYSLPFGRSYCSGNQYTNGPLGWGWRHNHAITATLESDGLMAVGQQFGVQGALTITELFVSMDLAADSSQPINKVVTMSLADRWWVDQIVNNIVVVSFPDGNQIFVKQPDGTYTPPYNLPSALTLSSGLYTLTTPQGIEYSFNSDGQINTCVYPAGVTITYSYSGGKLSTITNGLGRTLTLHYTGSQLTSVTDGNSRTISYAYDGDENLSTFTDALSNDITYQYDQPGRMTKYFWPANPSTAFITNVYDSLGRVETQANARGQVSTNYLAGARAELVDPVSSSTVSYFNGVGARTRLIDALGNETDTVYDGLNRAIQVTMPEGNKVQWTYDANNNILTRTRVPKPGSGLSNVVETFTYDPTWAKVATYEDGNSNTTTFTYDATQGTLLTIQRPMIGVSTPTVTMTYNARGQMETYEDETGVVTKFTYDATYEKMTSRIVDYNAGMGHLNLSTSYGYDSVGNCTSFTDPNSNTLTFTYDDERRATQRTEPSPFGFITNYSYDDNGFLHTTERQTGGSPAWQTYTFTYSVTAKRLTVTDPASNTTTWTYDSADRVQTLTDPESREWQYGYDALNRINQVTNPTSTICDARTFTNNGKLASITDAMSNTTQYTYDGLDRPDKTIYADTTFEENSSYDSNGNVLTYLTRSGNSIVKTYDVLNRLHTKTPTSQAAITYTYDLAGRLTKVNKAGTVGTDPSIGDMQFFFDTAGRFYSEEYPDSKTVTHVLDSNGNRTKTTWPDSYYVERVFDQLNRLTDIKLNGSASSAVSFSYNELSQRTQMTYINGASVIYAPQLNGDVTSIEHDFVGSSVTFTYGFNTVHEPNSVEVSDSTYMWHPAGAVTTTYAAADDVNKYPTIGGNSYTYDGNMNLTSDGTWTYTYDTENHLLSATKTGVSDSMVYDGMNRQSQKTVGSTKNRYIYSDWQRIADYDGTSGSLLMRYVYGTTMDEPVIMVSSGGTLTFLHADIVGSVVATSDNSGAETNKNLYSTFGEIVSLGGTTCGFTGQRYDSELGLCYLKSRYYAPALGRFLQPDTIGYTGEDFNLYSYVWNSPLRWFDPMGFQASGTTGGGPDAFSSNSGGDSGSSSASGNGAGSAGGGNAGSASSTSGVNSGFDGSQSSSTSGNTSGADAFSAPSGALQGQVSESAPIGSNQPPPSNWGDFGTGTSGGPTGYTPSTNTGGSNTLGGNWNQTDSSGASIAPVGRMGPDVVKPTDKPSYIYEF